MRLIVSGIVVCLILASAPLLGSDESSEANNESMLKEAQDAFELGRAALKKGDITLSTMYFANALARAPGQIEIVKRYVDVVLSWANGNDPSDSMEYLNNLDAFLNSQVVLVNASEIPDLVSLMDRVALVREMLMKQITEKTQSGDLLTGGHDETIVQRELKNTLEKARSSKTVKEHLEILRSALENLSEPDILDEEIVTEYQVGTTVDAFIQQSLFFIKLGTKKESNLQLNYLNAAESAVQQAVSMSANLPEIYRDELEDVKRELEKSVSSLSKVKSQEAFHAVNHLYAKMDLPKNTYGEGSASGVLRKIAAFMQDVAPYAQLITEPEHASKFSEIMSSIQRIQTDWQEVQLNRYNKWAVENMNKMVSAIKADDAFYKRTDKDKVASNLIRYMARIDTRYLNFGAMQCFNEAFSLQYNKLGEEHKQKVSKAMAFEKKRKLEDF